MDRLDVNDGEARIQEEEVQRVSEHCFAMAKFTCMSDVEEQLLNIFL